MSLSFAWGRLAPVPLSHPLLSFRKLHSPSLYCPISKKICISLVNSGISALLRRAGFSQAIHIFLA